MGDPDPKTEELRVAQGGREERERDQARRAAGDEESRLHSRRAERAAYLRQKLEQRADAERQGPRGRRAKRGG